MWFCTDAFSKTSGKMNFLLKPSRKIKFFKDHWMKRNLDFKEPFDFEEINFP